MRLRGFTLVEILVAVGVLALAGGVAMGLWVRSLQAEASASQMKGASEILRFFAGRVEYGDARFLPAPGGSKTFAYGELQEALRQAGINLARADQFRARITAQTQASQPLRVLYTLEVCYRALRGEECRTATLWGAGVLP